MLNSSLEQKVNVNENNEIIGTGPTWNDLIDNSSPDHFLDLRNDGEVTQEQFAAGTPTMIYSANTEDADNFVFLQYWMFQGFSGPAVDGMRDNIHHEGDLEYVQIAVALKDPRIGVASRELKTNWVAPFGAFAAQHYYGQTLEWNRSDGDPPPSPQEQIFVEHRNGRLVIYIAQFSHATYFSQSPAGIDVSDNPWDNDQRLGTQIQYDNVGIFDFAFDITGEEEVPNILWLSLDQVGTFNIWQGLWGYKESNAGEWTGPLGHDAPPGPPLRFQLLPGDWEDEETHVIIRNQPGTLHNECIIEGQLDRMEIILKEGGTP